MSCLHASTRDGDHWGYTAGVAVRPYTDEHRAAHGGVTLTVTCLGCGMSRQENRNGGHVERGTWQPAAVARRSR